MAENDHKTWYIHAAAILTALAALVGALVGVYKTLHDGSAAATVPAPSRASAAASPTLPLAIPTPFPPQRVPVLVQLERIQALHGASSKSWRFAVEADGKPVLKLASGFRVDTVPADLQLRESDPGMFRTTLVPGEELTMKITGVRDGGFLGSEVRVEGVGVLTAGHHASIAVKAPQEPKGSFVFYFSAVPIR